MHAQKKILFVITKSVWGGAQRYVYDLTTNLAKDHFDVAVACGGGGELARRLDSAGIRHVPIPALERDINPVREILALFSLIKIFVRERPNVIHLNSSKVGGFGGVAARIASLLTRHWSLVVFTVHGWSFFEDRGALWRAATMFLSWLSSAFQDRIIVINHADLAAAERFIPKRKLTLIPLAIATPSFLPRESARSYLAQKIGQNVSNDTLLVGTIAELTPTKGLAYLITAFKLILQRMTNTPFMAILIGGGEDETNIRTIIREQHLEERVFLAGHIPDAARYLLGFDMFVLSSVKEGLPYALLEAKTAGLPTVATTVGGIPDLIQSGTTGILVAPKNSEALANAMQKLMHDPTLRTTMGKQWRESSSTTLEAMIQSTRGVYAADFKKP